jgi:hypothetical protein
MASDWICHDACFTVASAEYKLNRDDRLSRDFLRLLGKTISFGLRLQKVLSFKKKTDTDI